MWIVSANDKKIISKYRRYKIGTSFSPMTCPFSLSSDNYCKSFISAQMGTIKCAKYIFIKCK